MYQRIVIACALLACVFGRAQAGESGGYPPPIKTSAWLETHQRLSFAVDGKNMEKVVGQGTNVLVGGTNAAGFGGRQ